MQRINIYEVDNTTNAIDSTSSRGSIFVPGFSLSNSVDVGYPVECRSIKEFVTNFGRKCPTFKGNENYYPYCKNPTPKATIPDKKSLSTEYYAAYDEAETVHFKLKVNASSSNYVTLYSKEKLYTTGDQCIQATTVDDVIAYRVFKCTHDITAGEEFDINHWSLALTAEDIVMVTKDDWEPHKNQTTFYELNITVNEKEVYANFVFLREKDEEGFPAKAIPFDESTVEANLSASISQVKMFNDGDYDPSWQMAYTYLSFGMPVVYVRMNNVTDPESPNYDVTPRRAYEFLNEFFEASTTNTMADILDRGAYNIQFITSGGYPVLEHSSGIDTKIIAFATPTDTPNQFSGRGDCLVLLDHTNNPHRNLIGTDSLFDETTITVSKYAAVFTPWCNTTLTTLPCTPASFIYLYNIASRISSANTWNIYAGIGNGRCSIIKSLNTDRTLTNKIAEYYQNDYGASEIKNCSINAITYIRNYGYCIWGNRTCEKYQADEPGFATSFVNIRNLVSEVKKSAYFASQALMFEVNGDVLWAKFKSKMMTLLEVMKDGNGLEDYTFIKNTSVDKTKLSVAIILYPTYGVESVEINVRLEDNTTTVEES